VENFDFPAECCGPEAFSFSLAAPFFFFPTFKERLAGFIFYA